MWRRTPILLVVLALACAPAGALARASRQRPRAFASCARLIGYERAHLAATHGLPELAPRALAEPAVNAPTTAGAVSPQASAQENVGTNSAGTSFSTTNDQEPGVEEPDIVKTDGSTIFTVQQGTLYAVAAGPAPRLEGSLALGSAGSGAQLLIRAGRLLVISGPPVFPPGVAVAQPAAGALAPLPTSTLSPYYYASSTTITEVDVHIPAAMRVTRTMNVEGTFVDARQNGGVARLVFSSAPRAIATPALASRSAGWVPTRRFHSLITGHRYSRPLASCSDVQRPAQFSGVGMLSILTVNLDRGLYATDSTALMADAQLVYGSSSSLYVATQRWINPLTPAAALPSSPETVIDRFDASGGEHTPLVASGVVPGYLLNQFSLSEYGGYLRVASTSRPVWWSSSEPPPSESYVTVLSAGGGSLTPSGGSRDSAQASRSTRCASSGTPAT